MSSRYLAEYLTGVAGPPAPQLVYPIADIASNGWLPSTYVAQRNLLTFTESFDNAAWAQSVCTITADAATDPNGGTTADVLVEAGAGAHTISRSVSLAPNADYTLSFFLQPVNRHWAELEIVDLSGVSGSAFFDLLNGAVGTVSGCTASIVAAGNGYFRCAITRNAGSGGGAPTVTVYAANGNGVTSYTSFSTSAINLWGAQLEQASAASAYQAVLGGAVTTDPLYKMLADGSTGTPDDTTYAYSPPNPTLPMREKFGPLNSGATVISARVQCLQQDTTYLFTLYCSGTQVAQWSQLVHPDQAVQQVDYTLTAAGFLAIVAAGGDRTDIELEILAGQ